MKTKIFQIDGLPYFLRYGVPLARLRCAGAPLLRDYGGIGLIAAPVYIRR